MKADKIIDVSGIKKNKSAEAETNNVPADPYYNASEKLDKDEENWSYSSSLFVLFIALF